VSLFVRFKLEKLGQIDIEVGRVEQEASRTDDAGAPGVVGAALMVDDERFVGIDDQVMLDRRMLEVAVHFASRYKAIRPR
jgi:hypothetical protein